MTFTAFLKKHYGAYTNPLNGQLIRLPSTYLVYENGQYVKADKRPEKGKYLCFFSSEARDNFLRMNAA